MSASTPIPSYPGISEESAPAEPVESVERREVRSATNWVVPVTCLALLLGVLVGLAVRTTARIRTAGLPVHRFGVAASVLATYRDQNNTLQKEIQDLRRQVRDYENNVQSGTRFTELLKRELAETKLLSGLAPVRGPGLRITLRDSTISQRSGLSPEDFDSLLVHDQDINGLLNELKAAGAEALAISGADGDNKQRVIVTTTARCVGPNAVVNKTQLSAPYTLWAIGNPKELRSALEMPNGFVQIRGLAQLKMIVIEEQEEIVLPEYAGTFGLRYASPAPEGP